MQILYIWFKQYKALNNFQTNFGSGCNFQFNGIDTLQIKDNDIYISDFFKNSLKSNQIGSFDISALVGENGSGKSTILDFLVQIMTDTGLNDYIIIYSHNNKLYKDYRFSSNLQLDFQTKNKFSIETRNFYHANYLTVFFSNIFDVRFLNSNFSEDTEEIINISTNALLSRHENVNEFMYEELQRQIFFVNKYKKKYDINRIIELPTKIKIENKDRISVKRKKYRYINDEEIQIFSSNNLKKSKIFKSKFQLNFIESYMLEIESILKESSISIPLEVLQRIVSSTIKIAKNEKDFMNILNGNLNKSAAELFLKLNFMNEVKELSDKYLQLYNLFSKLKIELRIKYEIDLITGEDIIYEYIEIDSTLSASKEFINVYINEFLDYDFLKFSWLELSSGQFSFLTLFSRFAYTIEKLAKPEKYNSYLLLIDEGDLYFHPQLQKDWLYYFVKMVDVIFKGDIQVILTTHSPFVLSDIPNTNVTFLSRESESRNGFIKGLEGSPRTFAANISELLSNSFFIREGLIGQFAKERINSCIRWLLDASPTSVYKERDSIIKFIDLIGEPLLRNKVYDIYKSKLKLFDTQDLLEITEIIELKISQLKKIVEEDKND
ncbi:AAA family ATPase [Lysinibacillus fusiformis]|uniref:AAA family ATPase n=1 Tax=Lysinibacillus fusiformis TaxID=28031 RepID=UPI003CFD1478